MSYETYTPVDLALDESFRQWVKHPTPEREAFWRHFLENYPQQQATVAEARALVLHLRVNPVKAEPEALQRMWNTIQQQTRTNLWPQAEGPAGRVRPLWQGSSWLRRAAVWAGLLLLAGLGYYGWLRPAQTTYETAYGETKTVTLPDGSVVTLNGNSTLALTDGWEDQTGADREVKLDGEAFFSVTKQQSPAGQPIKFRVRTSELAIDVLGTQFNVNHRRHRTEVVLQEGKVQVRNAAAQTPPTILEPGERVTYLAGNGQLRKETVNTQLYTSWRQNLLIFKNQSLTDIARSLEDSYGITVEFGSEAVAQHRFSGSVPTDSIALFFTKIERLYGVTVRREGNRYVVN